MPDLDRRVLELLDSLHEAPGNPGAWLRFLERLRDAISPDCLTLFASNPHETRPGVIAGSGIGVRAFPLGDVLRPSVAHPSAGAMPEGSVRELAPEVFEQSLLFRELLAPLGVPRGTGFVAVVERDERLVQAATLVVPRSEAWRPSATDRALLERLGPHMVLARRLHVWLAHRRRDTEALLTAFDHLVLGVVLLSASERSRFLREPQRGRRARHRIGLRQRSRRRRDRRTHRRVAAPRRMRSRLEPACLRDRPPRRRTSAAARLRAVRVERRRRQLRASLRLCRVHR
jgi:hypothetical protein